MTNPPNSNLAFVLLRLLRKSDCIPLFAMALAVGVGSMAIGQAPSEQLIVFVQRKASALAEQFHEFDLVRIEALAADMSLTFRVVDVADGAPGPITITPLIVYQNHLGRSVYQGRYRTLDRLRNFIFTSRVLPQVGELLRWEDVLVARVGRAKIALPVKITDLTGSLPADFNQDVFRQAMTDAIDAAMPASQRTARAELGRGDRFFYLDFHPYLSA